MTTEPYVVGRYYRVPCVRGKIHGTERDWPVIGPLHDDGEIIGFWQRHYHVDWRFVGVRDFERLAWLSSTTAKVLAVVLHGEWRGYGEWREHGLNAPLPQPRMLRRLCRRHMPDWADIPARGIPWKTELEMAFVDRRCKGKICPHRGVDLSTVAPDADGCTTCPAHGLRWDLETGAMAPTEWEREKHD